MPVFTHTRRSVLRIAGPDAAAFLQGLITADAAGLSVGATGYGALLSPQGRFLHDFLIFRAEETAFLLTPEQARAEDLLTLLKRYVLRASVTLALVPEKVLFSVDRALPGTAADPRCAALGFVGIGVPPQETAWEDYETLRLRHAVPDGGRDMPVGEALILDYGLDTLGAVAWTKGCYVGQEVTARMHYKAQKKKAFVPVHLEHGAFPALGTPLTPAGVMGSHHGEWGAALLPIEQATAEWPEDGKASACKPLTNTA
jgi:folate-binding protein YgfZ